MRLVPHVTVGIGPALLLGVALDHLQVCRGPRNERGVFGILPILQLGVAADFGDGKGPVVLHGRDGHLVVSGQVRTRGPGQAHRAVGLQDRRNDLAEHQAPGVHALEGGAVAGEEADGVELTFFGDGVEVGRREPRPKLEPGVTVKGGPVVAPRAEEAFERGLFREHEIPDLHRHRQGDFLAAAFFDREAPLVLAGGRGGPGLDGQPDALQSALLEGERGVGQERIGPCAGEFIPGELRCSRDVDFVHQSQLDVRRRDERLFGALQIPDGNLQRDLALAGFRQKHQLPGFVFIAGHLQAHAALCGIDRQVGQGIRAPDLVEGGDPHDVKIALGMLVERPGQDRAPTFFQAGDLVGGDLAGQLGPAIGQKRGGRGIGKVRPLNPGAQAVEFRRRAAESGQADVVHENGLRGGRLVGHPQAERGGLAKAHDVVVGKAKPDVDGFPGLQPVVIGQEFLEFFGVEFEPGVIDRGHGMEIEFEELVPAEFVEFHLALHAEPRRAGRDVDLQGRFPLGGPPVAPLRRDARLAFPRGQLGGILKGILPRLGGGIARGRGLRHQEKEEERDEDPKLRPRPVPGAGASGNAADARRQDRKSAGRVPGAQPIDGFHSPRRGYFLRSVSLTRLQVPFES